MSKVIIPLVLLFSLSYDVVVSQDVQSCIIDNINSLESRKDPKCHATANRLEDFMYGTPLQTQARESKIDLQKKLILFIWDAATKKAISSNQDSIYKKDLGDIINPLVVFGKLKNGKWFINVDNETIEIEANDLRQYSSVAYSLRAMLSVEQDFLFNPTWELKPLSDESISAIKLFLDIVSLATLKIADSQARKKGLREIDKTLFENSWNYIFEKKKEEVFVAGEYPESRVQSVTNKSNSTIRSIIEQKIESYKQYNSISLPILLRNIQVYFARHKWPTDENLSNELRTYLVESLVETHKGIHMRAHDYMKESGDQFIRADHMNKSVEEYLPISINSFEDVTYFPALKDNTTIESYDLDAFRDSGLHWLILKYVLDDIEDENFNEIDPFAAEIIVESIAQWALLVLRKTGDHSVQNGNAHIEIDDMKSAFISIQDMINRSAAIDESEQVSEILSQSYDSKTDGRVWEDVTDEVNLDFYHKSSDWLSRLIRGYVFKKDENLVRMAIPPAFGGSGIAAEDFNNDGWDDLLLLGGMGNKLYLNNKNGGFEDRTEQYGVNIWYDQKQSYAEVRQCIVVDFNNDGWQDLFLSLVDDNHKIFKNINGERFEDMSLKSGFDGLGLVGGPATSFDYNGDGLLDVYVGYFGNYLEGQLPTLDRNNQNGSPNKLYKNLGDFKFEEVDHLKSDDVDKGWTQALVHVDLDQNGHQDVIVGNDFGINAYYMNNGNGTFTNLNRKLNTNKPSYTMSIGSSDLNGDKLPDLYISNIVVMEKDEKYVNPEGTTVMQFDPEKMQNIRTVEANDLFLSFGEEGKLSKYVLSKDVGRGYSSTGWSWDADFFDYDNDGDDDLYCLNGMNDFRVYGVENPFYNSPEGEDKEVVYAQSNKERNVFFVNENGKMVEKSSVIGGDLLSNSRSAAYLDYDKDGDLDIVVNNYHGPANFLENTTENDFNWIKIRLKGNIEKGINKDCIGGQIIVKNEEEGLDIWREIHSTTGYLSVHPKTQHFGISKVKEVNITVKWTNGEVSNYKSLKANTSYEIEYGADPQILPF